MNFSSFRIPLILTILSLVVFPAFAWDLKCYQMEGCMQGGGRSNSANPSTGSQVRINPSAVPTENGFGIEGIYFDQEVDFALVRGLGRVGAAISPANSEETFFGPPGLELPPDLLRRKQESHKFENHKITFASAFDLIPRKDSGLSSFGLKLGLMAKYNQLTHQVSPGGGVSAVLGFLTAGAAVYNDETQLDYSPYVGFDSQSVIKYKVETYSGGLSLNSLLVDYSVLRMKEDDTDEVSTIRLLTASLFWKKFLFTASKRNEDSDRPAYNFQTQQLEVQREKEEYFGGIQIYASKNLVLGALYNYYLLREYSATATLFF